MFEKITLVKHVNASPERVFEAFVNPDDLVNWYHASEGWTTPYAKIDAVPGGKLVIRFEDPTGANSFDLTGTIDEVKRPGHISYTMDDGRNVDVRIEPDNGGSKITEIFDAEKQMSIEVQKEGWMSILENLEDYLDEVK